MRFAALIDGWNLHEGCQAQSGLQALYWVDPLVLARFSLARFDPGAEITSCNYYTARLNHDRFDPSRVQRQQAYLRALSTLTDLIVIEGYFTHAPPYVEKQTDVRLAVDMVAGALRRKLDGVLLISNDSDFAPAIKVVAGEEALPVFVVNPHGLRNRSTRLTSVATRVFDLREGDLIASQLPGSLKDSRGTIHKPDRPW